MFLTKLAGALVASGWQRRTRHADLRMPAGRDSRPPHDGTNGCRRDHRADAAAARRRAARRQPGPGIVPRSSRCPTLNCRLEEQGASAALYLGAVELVGGKSDGQTQRIGFRFDLKFLLEQFSRVDDLSWTVLDHGEGGDRRQCRARSSSLTA
jgi:hypothetical protein